MSEAGHPSQRSAQRHAIADRRESLGSGSVMAGVVEGGTHLYMSRTLPLMEDGRRKYPGNQTVSDGARA